MAVQQPAIPMVAVPLAGPGTAAQRPQVQLRAEIPLVETIKVAGVAMVLVEPGPEERALVVPVALQHRAMRMRALVDLVAQAARAVTRSVATLPQATVAMPVRLPSPAAGTPSRTLWLLVGMAATPQREVPMPWMDPEAALPARVEMPRLGSPQRTAGVEPAATDPVDSVPAAPVATPLATRLVVQHRVPTRLPVTAPAAGQQPVKPPTVETQTVAPRLAAQFKMKLRPRL